jgi:hypothetical protein
MWGLNRRFIYLIATVINNCIFVSQFTIVAADVSPRPELEQEKVSVAILNIKIQTEQGNCIVPAAREHIMIY